MIKITKPGQKEFHGFCKWCGCEFTYEISDLKLSATSDKVSCPTCGQDYYHPPMVQDPTIPGGIGRLQMWPPEPIPCTPDMTKTDPCAGCPWRENLFRDGLYIGDTPCTWCDQGRFNVNVGTSVQGSSTLEQHINTDIKDLDAKYFCSTSSTNKDAASSYTLLNGDLPTLELGGAMAQKVYDAAGCPKEMIQGSADNVTNGTVMTTILNTCNDCVTNFNKCGDTESNSCQADSNCKSKRSCKCKH